MPPSEREENLVALGATPWISRVPASIAAAQQLMPTLPSESFTVSSLNNNYSMAEVCTTYGGVRQRWLVVQSESRISADLKQLDKRIAQAKTKKIKALKELGNHPFACEADAVDAAKAFDKKLKYHRLTDIEILQKPHYDKAGRPRKGDVPKGYTYHISATLALNESAVEAQRNQAGRFVLATNLLDDQQWSNDMVLQEYKNQQSCERGKRIPQRSPLFCLSDVCQVTATSSCSGHDYGLMFASLSSPQILQQYKKTE